MTEPSPFSQMIVIGSSAGGVEALSTLVQTLPADLAAPVVVAQHLDPARESRLGEILSRSSTLPVRTLSEHERLEPGVVYVVPANRDVEITDHDIRLLTGSHRSRPSIDHMFETAAQVFGEDLIAVVLTGTGSDGAAGALEVRHAGGAVIIQDPATASFPALPGSLSPTAVDFVVPLEEIGPLLQGLVSGTPALESPEQTDSLQLILRLLRDQHGIDFRSYKPSTIMRRLQRRLTVTRTQTITQYLRYLEQHPDEEQTLIASFLIKVTSFFRDAELFDAIRDHVLPEVVEAARHRDHIIRFWSAGCATGEEAYSLAILLAEYLGDELEHFHVRIFATDLDADAINFARQGVYSTVSLSGVAPEILDRYFEPVEGGYQISKGIRALMVFGQHDLGERAPFPRVDLVLCRNVLIYFTSELQRRILQLFAFSLRDSGYLILGKSEATTAFAEAFVADDSHLKIYRRRGGRSAIPSMPLRDMAIPAAQRITAPRTSAYRGALPPQPSALAAEQPYGLRQDTILYNLPIGVVVIDRHYDIQYINDTARTLLSIHTSAIGDDLIHLVRSVSPGELRSVVDRAFAQQGRSVATLKVVDGAAEATRHLEVVCTVETGNEESTPRVSICLSDVTQTVEERRRLEDEVARAHESQERAREQRQNLADSNRELLSANQQLTRELAEVRSQNETFLVGNEELQAAAEEVETLNEELQATNEELETLNEELQATVEELNATNEDLQTRNAEIQNLAVNLESARAHLRLILDSLSEAIVVVDKHGDTLLTNARYDELFSTPLDSLKILATDGSPLAEGELPHQRAARGESFRARFAIPTRIGTTRDYEVTGRPVREDGDAGGVLIIRNPPDAELSA